MQEIQVQSLGQEDPLVKEMATCLPGEFHGQRNLAGYSSWDCKTVRHNLATKQQQQTHVLNALQALFQFC